MNKNHKTYVFLILQTLMILAQCDFTAMGLNIQSSDKDNNYYCTLGCNVHTYFEQTECQVTGTPLEEGYAIGIDQEQQFECNFYCDDFGTCTTINDCFIDPDSQTFRLYQAGQISFYSFDIDTNCSTVTNNSTYIRQCINVCSSLQSGRQTVCNVFTGDQYNSSATCIDTNDSLQCLDVESSTDYIILPECSNGSITVHNSNDTIKCETTCNGLNCDTRCKIDDDNIDKNTTLYAYAIVDMILLGLSIILIWIIMYRVHVINYKPLDK